MIILGIDPGLQKTGWGVVLSHGSSLKLVSCGLIRSSISDPLPVRLAGLHRGLSDVIETYRPDYAAMEETFVNKNPASALKLGQARGALLAVPALHDVPVAEYAANKIKKAVTGAGHAGKEQIALMVRSLLPSCGQISEDEADALAVAICHAHYGRGMAQRAMLASLEHDKSHSGKGKRYDRKAQR